MYTPSKRQLKNLNKRRKPTVISLTEVPVVLEEERFQLTLGY